MTEEKMQFVARLVEIVTLLGYPEHGRQSQLAAFYKVTQGAARKWFAGETMPSYEICADLCKRARVSFEWLMTGRGSKSFQGEYKMKHLIYVDFEELGLITSYREANILGKESILTAALQAPRESSLELAVINNKS